MRELAEQREVFRSNMNSDLPKLGIILQYYNLRPDIPALIDVLSEDWQIVLFARPDDLRNVVTEHEKRAIPREPRTVRNQAARLLFELAGNVPAGTETFKQWRLRQLARHPSALARWKDRVLLETRLRMAGLIPFDKYLDWMQVDERANISDIDVFLATSDVYDVNFLAQIVRSKVPLFTYIYSWDHAAKHHKFSHRVHRYLTWNPGISDDIHELHAIPRETISEVGSTQLTLVEQYLAQSSDEPRAVPHERYVYYAATWGYPEVMDQELRIVKLLAQMLRELDPAIVLLVRPYPNAKAFEPYRSLVDEPNVRLDNTEFNNGQVVFCRDSNEAKYTKLRDAELFIHMGSTIGLEAAYFDVPILHLAIEDGDYGRDPRNIGHLTHSFQQRHLKKYMLSSQQPNVIRRVADLQSVISRALASPTEYLAYNHELRQLNPLMSIREIGKQISHHLRRTAPFRIPLEARSVGSVGEGTHEVEVTAEAAAGKEQA